LNLQTDQDYLRKKLVQWRDSPNLFVADLWPELKLEIWQKKVLEILPYKQRISVKSGHGTGKSALMSWILLWFLSTRTPAKVPTTAPTASQLYDVLWAEKSMWLRMAKYNFASLFHQNEDTIQLLEAPKENFGIARTARRDQPESLAGKHAKNILYLIDEASGIPNNVYEVIEGSMSTAESKIILFSNPTRTSGYFFDTFHRFRAKWTNFTVSCFDSSQVDPKYIEDMAKYGLESNIYKIRVLGEFPVSNDDCIIGLDVLEAAVNRGIEGFGETVWGVDVARYGFNRTALAKRQGPKLLEPLKYWAQKDLMSTVGLIKTEWDNTEKEKKPSKIVVDVVGLGAGVVDRLKELELPVVGINACEVSSMNEKYPKMRDELWFAARDWFNEKACDIPEDQVLISELAGPRYKVLSNGKIRVETKDEMKARGLESPDGGDAFTLTFSKEKPRMRIKPINNYPRPSSWMG